MSRTLKQQWGLEADPHADEHVMAGSTRLTKTTTVGGHEVGSQQPGLPVYHRRIANPFPLFAIGIGASLLILGLVFVGHRGLTSPHIGLNVGLPLGGIGLLTAMVFAFAEGNTFLCVAAGSLGGLIGGTSLVNLPWTGIQAAYVMEAEGNIPLGTKELYNALAVVFICSFVPVFIIFLASFKTAAPVSSAALFIVIALIVLGVGFKEFPAINLMKTGGALFILVGVTLFYSAASVLLAEEGVKILPVLPLPRGD
ncbi:hypothetical protein IE81DRAFT_321862 [Ceraceosorus guamensis]|uniref:Uncharacterized protein n=1 Tax=Ceraceosorus guamensis TaxID=1522189 RepID=A0A316W258_9BASI|nr:hypothetical protein IE81DRAFT_321862 [Ceraceosorus guamensis]PWN43946.1 hypothetical protein IE81DRAFT_321862 [Ceraceosorus guamensis]